MTDFADQRILEALSILQYRRDRDTSGICYNLQYAVRHHMSSVKVEHWLRAAFKTLGLHSTYPVPHPEFHSNEAAYEHRQDLHWAKATPYGANRLHLLSLLIRLARGEKVTASSVLWPHPPKGAVMSYRQKVLSITTLQGVFDHAVSRVIRNRRPAYDTDAGCCQYRTARVGGYRAVCAVGSLILDKYNPAIEGEDVLDAEVLATLPDNIRGIPDVGELLHSLQRAHDGPAEQWARGKITRKEFLNLFRARAAGVAQQYGLSPEVAQQ